MPKDNIQRAIDRGTGAGARRRADRAGRLRGLRPRRRRDPGRGADRQPQPHRRRGPPRLRQGRRQPRRAGLGRLAVREEGRDPGRRRSATREEDLIAAIDAGAEDVARDGDVLKVTTEPASLTAVRAALEGTGSRSSRPSWRWSRARSSRSRRSGGAGAGPADRGARRPRRRRGRARELRHPRGAARAGRGLARRASWGRHPGRDAESSGDDPRHGHRPGRGEHRFRRRPRRRRADDRRRRRRDRGAGGRAARDPARPHPRRAREADRAGTSRPRSRSRTSTSARTCARRSPSARRAGSRCSPPPSARSRASTTRPQAVKMAVCGSGSAAKRQVQQMVGTLLGLARAARVRPHRRRARGRDLPRGHARTARALEAAARRPRWASR